MKQHKTPCGRCPFRRTSLPGWLGGMSSEDFMRLAEMDARMPCHCASKNSNGIDYAAAQEPGTKEHGLPQCAGRAIHWANRLKTPRVPEQMLLELPKNTADVFTWPPEFIAHHNRLLEKA